MELRQDFSSTGVQFGVGLSPFEVYQEFGATQRNRLSAKLQRLNELELDYLGLFFDDMKGEDDLALKQSEIVAFVAARTKAKLLFCPTYYSLDPILDKVFGTRDPDYLSQLAQNIAPEIELLWTGPKVIAEDITSDHLVETAELLGRKPFLWDNFYANDGPKNCQFMKLKPFTGRDTQAFQNSSGWMLNPMNQAFASQLVLQSVAHRLRDSMSPEASFKKALQTTPPELQTLLQSHQTSWHQNGLQKISSETKAELIKKLGEIYHPLAKEVLSWLNGDYLVDSECLTD